MLRACIRHLASQRLIVKLALVACACLLGGGLVVVVLHGSSAPTIRSVEVGETPLDKSVVPTPIGRGARYQLPSAPPRREAADRLMGRGFTCAGGGIDRRGASLVHVEVFADGQVLLVPKGVGLRGVRSRGAYVQSSTCRFPMWTIDPTGVVAVSGGHYTLADLFLVWGQPLSRSRVASFRAARAGDGVSVFLNGKQWKGEPGSVPLTNHAQIVVEINSSVPPHPGYLFPPA